MSQQLTQYAVWDLWVALITAGVDKTGELF
jgi:hypothetical protein